MAYDRDAEFAKMATNLQEKTGGSIDEVDDEVIGWLKQAYEGA